MEEIFNDPQPRKKKEKINTLHNHGLNNNQIALKLGVSRQYVGKILDGLQCKPDVNQISQNVNKDVNQCKPTEEKESVADLKVKLNNILDTIYKRINEIEKRQEDIQRVFNLKAERVIKHFVDNTLKGFVEQEIKKLKEELTEQKKSQ